MHVAAGQEARPASTMGAGWEVRLADFQVDDVAPGGFSSWARLRISITWKGWMSAMRRAILSWGGLVRKTKSAGRPALFEPQAALAARNYTDMASSNSSRLSMNCLGGGPAACRTTPWPASSVFQASVDLGQGFELGLGDVGAGPVDVFVQGIQPRAFSLAGRGRLRSTIHFRTRMFSRSPAT
jgi:hypothetical protein